MPATDTPLGPPRVKVRILAAERGGGRLAPTKEAPAWARHGAFASATRTGGELSLVCEFGRVPEGQRREGPFRAFEVAGPLDFALTGILSALLAPLAEAGISIFAVSTFDTDYVLVKADRLAAAVAVLRAAGHEILGG